MGRYFNKSIVKEENATFDSFLNTIFFLHYEKSWLLFHMIQSIFIYMKGLFCSVSLNFGNSPDKYLHLMYVQI